MKDIIIYSKKDGVNQLLPIFGNSLEGSLKIFEMDRFKEHKLFAYALIDGVEIKLFSSTENREEQSFLLSEDELSKIATQIHQAIEDTRHQIG
ncbi:hypothetical protein [Enterococcus olivae]